MAIVKVLGLETEYGIIIRGATEPNPIAASSTLINAYVAELSRKVSWDFEDETPGRDARGFAREGAMPPEVETHLVNAVLTNGARYYVDHAHPEFSTPECADVWDALLYDKAGELILARSVEAAGRLLPPGQSLMVLKNNSDGKGNSYGTHENYLMDRALPFARIVQHVMPHFVSRQVFTGAGKVGTEAASTGGIDVDFQLTQRADFFEEEVGLETTLKRPIVNTRDEPHCDAGKYRRLHVIVGDANMSEVATFLKVGTTALVLSMIEDDWFSRAGRDFTLQSPVASMRRVSYDRELTRPIPLADGRSMTALEMQWEHLDLARKYAEDRGLDSVGGSQTGNEILRRWEEVLTGLESDPMSLARQLDWVAKYRMIEGYRERHGLDWHSPKLAAMDLQYHDVRPERSLYARAGMERLLDPDAIARAVTEPPETTRAYFRGKCLQRWASAIAAANWDSVVFDLGKDPLRRVPMMEPLRGTRAHVEELLSSVSSPAELLDRLGS
ncbi:proteasome accessory factor PafA2 [Acidiferrimicrobium sp. IK]|uniref:depupylase/deamidase Dop n=1 Tax=Acidiferrimicrobium sp. IK TaxID=2871700 RepID=UPI0021CB4F91|nr:depupylase/deamidase Dop [Acidiferrimicrobium sp. IK]MCU4184660.1 proteasome accessory factor PafA2 [Acidiferrimicrobium sp. IK]